MTIDVFPEPPVIPEIKIPEIKVPESPKIELPEVKVPEAKVTVEIPPIDVPEPKVTVNIPEPKTPIVNVPETVFPEMMNVTGAVSVMNDRATPIPMTPVDLAGNPISMGGSQMAGGSKISKVNVLDKHGNVITPSAGEFVDPQNSSDGALDAAGVFTGQWVDTNGYSGVKVAVTTDQDGSYTIQWSPDGVNADSTLTRYYRTAQIEPPHKFENMRRYMRVVFTNGSTDQTYFRLQTTLTNSSGILNIPVDGTMSQDYDAISTRPTDFHNEVALGRRQGVTTWNKFGYNDDIDTSTDPEIIAEFGGTFQYLTSGETIDIVSSSTNDDADPATGAQQVIIWGVDENWDNQTEVVVMDGTSTVTTTSQWIGINRVSIYKAGTGLKNDGTITVTATTSGYNMASMPAEEGTTQQLLFYVARNHQFNAEWLYFNATKVGGSSPTVTLKGLVYSDVATAEFEVYRDTIDTADNEHIDLKPPLPFVIGEKSILWFTGETDTNNTVVRGRFSGELFRDADA
jgi:hypothetical protein